MKSNIDFGDPKKNSEELLQIAKYKRYLINNSIEAIGAFHSSPFIISYRIYDFDLKNSLCKSLEIYDMSYNKIDLFHLVPLWILNENIRSLGPELLNEYYINMEVLCFYLLNSIKISNNRLDPNISSEIYKILEHIERESFINYKVDKQTIYSHVRESINKKLNKMFHLSTN